MPMQEGKVTMSSKFLVRSQISLYVNKGARQKVEPVFFLTNMLLFGTYIVFFSDG
jgi:hypothetical protein